MLLYLGSNWLLGWRSKTFHAPLWWRVWLVATPLLFLGIPAITMGFSEPVLSWTLAIKVTLVTLSGVALALLPGELAARNPGRLLWLAADGWGLALIVLTLPHLEDFRLWLSTGRGWQLTMGLVLMLSGLLWVLLLSFLRARLQISIDRIMTLFLAGCCVAYLLIPLVHHMLDTDGYFYLTNSDNFFARGLGIQLVAWLGTALVSSGIVLLRFTLATRRERDVE